MLNYARSDTHYLLYIFDRMRNDLISKSDPMTLNLLRVALARSAETSLRKYKKYVYDNDGKVFVGKKLLTKYKKSFDQQQVGYNESLLNNSYINC